MSITDVASGVGKVGVEKGVSVPGGANDEVLANVRAKEQRLSDEVEEDVPPNGGYGWVCVGCVAVINAVSLFPFFQAPRELQCLLKSRSTLLPQEEQCGTPPFDLVLHVVGSSPQASIKRADGRKAHLGVEQFICCFPGLLSLQQCLSRRHTSPICVHWRIVLLPSTRSLPGRHPDDTPLWITHHSVDRCCARGGFIHRSLVRD
jgi:hypothetical protein